MGKNWIKLWVSQTLYGTTFSELDYAERGIWFSLLLLAASGDPRRDGCVEIRAGVGYPHDALAQRINCPISILIESLTKLIKFDKIFIDSLGVINIKNWDKYQTSYEKRKTVHIDTGKDTGGEKIREDKNPLYPPRGDDDKFFLFWKTWPRKVNKAAAIRAWTKLNPDQSLFEKIIAALKMQKQSLQWQKDNGQFIPHPSTWINGRRWEDEFESEKKTW